MCSTWKKKQEEREPNSCCFPLWGPDMSFGGPSKRLREKARGHIEQLYLVVPWGSLETYRTTFRSLWILSDQMLIKFPKGWCWDVKRFCLPSISMLLHLWMPKMLKEILTWFIYMSTWLPSQGWVRDPPFSLHCLLHMDPTTNSQKYMHSRSKNIRKENSKISKAINCDFVNMPISKLKK